ncbi:ABC transporter permease [Clostridium niameyense]|uniref:ABC transporter permease n=1 Tax=Clostridium niameyense TaxID=1622073 RepID=UPI00067F03FC|nr:ABC transporter permease [Clostridium niameyense]
MSRLLKISWFNVKNIINSKKFLLGVSLAFVYSLLWILLVHPSKYTLLGYSFEIGRFLYVIILYSTVSMLRDDIKSNSSKTVFSGIFSRVEIMLSKGIGLLILGVLFFLIVEINNLLAAFILYKNIGISGFLNFDHLQLFIVYVVITFCMGSIMLFIISIKFNDKKSILFYILMFSMINFYTSAIVMLVHRKPEFAERFSLYMKTPFYSSMELTQGYFNKNSLIINIVWALIFFIASIIIMNRREIK